LESGNECHEFQLINFDLPTLSRLRQWLFGALTLAQGRYPVSENLHLFVMVGLCGGYTTLSSFSLQTFDLMREGAIVRAAINVVASVVLCICAVVAGPQTLVRVSVRSRSADLRAVPRRGEYRLARLAARFRELQ
jgi:hypothetical protein